MKADVRVLCGREVPAIGQGTWALEEAPRAEAVAVLRRGLELGLTHVDTAEMYGAGSVEEIVGEAIAGRRDDVFLVSKVLPENASRAGTVKACERSLARLRTDHLDLYLLHWPGGHEIRETIDAFESLVTRGLIRAWGVSNFDVRELAAAEDMAGPGRMACNQVLCHVGERGIEHAVIPWCLAHGVPVVAYSSLGSGSFPAQGSRERVALEEVAARRGASAHQVALRFVLRVPGVLTIPKAATLAHVLDNAAALSWSLDVDEIAALERAFPQGPPPRTLPTI